MKTGFSRIFLFVALLFTAFTSNAQEIRLSDNTLGAFYLNLQAVYEIYASQVKEMLKPENTGSFAEINSMIKKQLKNESFDLKAHIDKFLEFEKSRIFVPDGPVWFCIDAKYHPALSIKAKIKPEEFVGFIEGMAGKNFFRSTDEAKKKYVAELPTPLFKLDISIDEKGIELVSDEKMPESKDSGRWKELVESASRKDTLLDAQIDFAMVKALLAAKYKSAKHSECFGNIMTIQSALEMYKLDTGKNLDNIDFALLAKEHYLAREPVCAEGGKYSLENDKSGAVVCSVHGSIEKPKETKIDLEKNSDPRLKAFDIFRFVLRKNSLDFKVKINDKATLEQWLAIGKQQILAIKHMAMNQISGFPVSTKEKAIEIIDSIKCKAEGDWLVISAVNFNEKTVVSGFMGAIAAVSAVALPKLKQVKEQVRDSACQAMRKVLSRAVMLYNLDHPDGTMYELDMEKLISGGYLKEPPVCSEGGSYKLNKDGKIECSKHGL
ncbi:MAG: hypothetical protein Kow0029_03500 [Candidatus Rifleibacteriota bacterium]